MTARTLLATTVCALLLFGLPACGSEQHQAPAASPTTKTSPTTGPTTVPAGQIQKVLVVIEENHSYAQMRQGMPFLADLSERYGYATHWTALAHPSLPNYLGIAGGTTFGILDDRSPAAHTSDIGSAISVFDQAIAAGKTAATYAETMSKQTEERTATVMVQRGNQRNRVETRIVIPRRDSGVTARVA